MNIESKMSQALSGRYFKQLVSIVLGAIIICIGFIAWSSPAQADDYFKCFETGSNPTVCPEPVLVNSCFEAPGSGQPRCCEGTNKDYDISVSDQDSDVTVLAIHGGGVEANTSKISRDLATPRKWNRYTFSAHGRSQCLLGKSNFKVLHITSTNFNHQTALDLVKGHPKSISIHGYIKEREYPEGVICVGGKNQDQIKAFISHVNANSSTFTDKGGYNLQPVNAPEARSGFCVDRKPYLKGTSKRNIVNNNSEDKGLQLEFSPTMREDLVDRTEQRYETLRNIIYGAIDQVMGV
jgi:phage replication-related protein YjqB (UPF0714/DUF867 family)